jgi:Flp pilus assembly protein TadB
VNVFLLVIGVLLVGATAWLLARAFALPRLRMDAHLSHIVSYGVEQVSGEVDSPTARSELDQSFGRFAERLGTYLTGIAPSVSPLKRGELAAAGIYSMTPETVHGYRLMAAVACPALVLMYAVVLGGSFSLIMLLLIVGAGALGWYGPALMIRQRGRERLRKLDRELPDLIDLLLATVEAGIGLGGALKMLAERFEGPLGEELQITLQQQNLGSSTATALGEMAERADTPAVRSFVRTLVRAEALGGSIGPILRNLAVEMRKRRRQAAQEQAQKTPIKLLFPLMFLIFPSLFIVLLYPAGYTIVHQLGNG